jgi:transcriptional regulator with XRE-family HTH domain
MERIHPLRRWRQDNDVTLAELAARDGVDVSASHLSEIERGLNTLSLGLAVRLSKATGGKVRVEEFDQSKRRSARLRPPRRRAA